MTARYSGNGCTTHPHTRAHVLGTAQTRTKQEKRLEQTPQGQQTCPRQTRTRMIHTHTHTASIDQKWPRSSFNFSVDLLLKQILRAMLTAENWPAESELLEGNIQMVQTDNQTHDNAGQTQQAGHRSHAVKRNAN
jgi:hypothetical protein